jgi:hypothetical protein
VTQKLLNHSQIRSGIEHVGGKRMAQGMGRNRYQKAAFFRYFIKNAGDGPGGKAPVVLV